MIPIHLKVPSDITIKYDPNLGLQAYLGGPNAGEYYELKYQKDIPRSTYDKFFDDLQSIYGEDFIWKEDQSTENYKFILKGGYGSRFHALMEFNFPGCPRGILIKLNNFSIYIENLISMENTTIYNIDCDPNGFIYTYNNLDLFEKDIKRWNPKNIDSYLYDINCIRVFSKYRLGYRSSVEDIYKDVSWIIRDEKIDATMDNPIYKQ